jgi:hypothetical protein
MRGDDEPRALALLLLAAAALYLLAWSLAGPPPGRPAPAGVAADPSRSAPPP